MDFYKSMTKLFELFEQFVEKVPSFGKSIICLDDKNNKKLIKKLKLKLLYLRHEWNANFNIVKIIQKTKFKI